MSPWSEEILQGRYQIIQLLQQRNSTLTYQALDLKTQQQVILKCLNIAQLQDWQSYELFERELKILAGLNHPRIPKLVDHFELEQSQPEQKRFSVLVLELIQGQTLRQRLNTGWLLDEASARDLLIQALEILIYLQSQPTPMIHRDIKPDNLMLDDHQQLYLLDFGAARSYHPDPSQTAVGTFGYMAPEQALGQPPLASSDLYALGMTALELLTRQAPQVLPRQDLHLDFQSLQSQGLLNVSAEFQNWLQQLVEPDPKQRFYNAQQALNRLKSGQSHSHRPAPGTHLLIRQFSDAGGQLIIQIYPSRISSLLQMPILKRLLVSLAFAIGIVWSCWLALFILLFWIDQFYYLLDGVANDQLSGITRQIVAGFDWLCRLFILWRVLRQAEAPLRLQTFKLEGILLTYQTEGWLSRRRRVFDLHQVSSLSVRASGMVIETQPLPFLAVQAPLQRWLRPYQVPAPLTEIEQQLIQTELKRYILQALPPDKARTLLDNSF